MPHPPRLIAPGSVLTEHPQLAEAAGAVGLTFELVGTDVPQDAGQLAGVDLIVVDESGAYAAAAALERAGSLGDHAGPPRFLILCGPSALQRGDVRSLLASGHADCADRGDTTAILTSLIRAAEEARAASAESARSDHSRAMFDALCAGMIDGAFIKDTDGRYVMTNEAHARTLGRPVEEVLGRTDGQLLGEEIGEQIEEGDRCIRELGEFRTFEEQFDLGGTARAFLTTKGPWRDERGRMCGIVGITRDITDRKRIEEELGTYRNRLEESVRERTRQLEESHQRQRLTERMAAMGTLATGIGHDIGNLVLPLRIALESLERKGRAANSDGDLQAIRRSVEYLQGLANGLRYLAMDPEDVGVSSSHSDLLEWWADVTPLLKNCLPRDVALERDFADGLPYVAMPMHHLTQIVFNLVQNAGDAMRGRGEGRVRVQAKPHPEPGESATAVRLSVIDDGPGMTPDVRERCLEPFFTTKFRSVSTGLGLPLVHGLVQKAGGEVVLDSEPGRGTRWTFILPARPKRRDVGDGEIRLHARVDLSDTRIRAYVTSMLRSLDFEISEDGHSSGGRTVLYVTEPQTPLGRAARTLLEEDDRLRVVLFGGGGDEAHPRLHQIGQNPSSATIRATLRNIRDVAGG